MRNPKRLLLCAVLSAAGFLAWQRTLRNAFLYDDDTFIVLNKSIRTLSPLSKFLTREATSDNPQMNQDVWRPLTTFSYALNYAYAGPDPRSFSHLLNLFLHLLNGLLVFFTVLLIVEAAKALPAKTRGDPALFVAFGSALVFLLHPVQAETVAWVSQRSNELFLLFYLASFILFTRANPRRPSLGGASILCFALALLSKEMAVSLPLVLFGYLWIIRRKGAWASLLRVLPHAFIAILFVLARSSVLGQTAQTTYWAGGFVSQMLTMLKGFFFYIRLLFVPYPLSVEYLFPTKTAFDAELLAYALVFAAIVWAAWKSRKDNPLVSFGVFLFFASLGPVSNIIPIRTIINERFLYLGVIGFGLVLGGLLTARECSLRRPLRYLVLAALALPYCSISTARVKDWKDHWSFVTANLKTCPQSATLHYGMGRVYASRGEFDRAAKEYELALSIDPMYAEALNDLGLISAKEGRMEEAIGRYRQSLQKRVDFADALQGLGAAYLNQAVASIGTRKGDLYFREAAQALQKAAELKPENLETWSNLAAAYAYMDRLEDAIALSQAILRRDPGLSRARSNLALFQRTLAARAGRGPLVSEFVKDRFRDPEVLMKLASARPAFLASGGYYEARAGAAQEPPPGDEALKPEEKKALAALAAREGGFRYFLGRRYSDGYRIEFASAKVALRPLRPAADPALAFEPSAAVYREAAPGLDVLIVPAGPAFETLYLADGPEALRNLEYEVSASKGERVWLNGSGEFAVSSAAGEPLLTLSKPVLLDASGKRVEGLYTLSNAVLAMEFPRVALDYPVLIDPVWTAVGSMAASREAASATLLADGTVLIAGGRSAGATYLSSGSLYDPIAGTFAATAGVMVSSRAYHSAVLLPSGKVLIAGGMNGAFLNKAELYDPVAKTFSTTGNMTVARSSATATLLSSRKVLIAGGKSAAGTYLSTAELYDLAAATFAATTGSMSGNRASHAATLLPDGDVLVTGGQSAAATFLSTAEIYSAAGSAFTATGSMSAARAGHSASLLPTGVILVAGGQSASATFLSTAELYNISGATFSATDAMVSTRAYHTATVLPNGNALLAGGRSGPAAFLSTAEVYDTAAASFSATGSMGAVRFHQNAVLLANGQVLLAGGRSAAATFLSTSELYNPSVGAFAATGSMTTIRTAQSSTLLPSGKVLIAGGLQVGGNISTAELYDPETGTFSATGSMSIEHRDHSATLMPTGKVLIAGGYTGPITSTGTKVAELYSASSGTFVTTGSMFSPRRQQSATLLPIRQVLITGGANGTTAFSTAEFYNVDGGTFTVTGSMTTNRRYHTATFLRQGKCLIVGGQDGVNALSTTELYDIYARTFAATGSMTTRRQYHTETILQNGKVLITGGDDGTNVLSTAELYNPSTAGWTATGSMTTTRRYHTASLLLSGKVLFTGGGTTGGTNISTAEVYDPATGLFTATSNSMSVSREYHNSAGLADGTVLISGGDSSAGITSTADIIRYTEYDHSRYAAVMQPAIDVLNALSTITFTVTGANFRGYGEGSGGGNQNSATNHPKIYLQFMDSGNYGNMPGNSDLVDLSTSNYPMSASQWANSANAATFTVPPNLRNGCYLLYVVANAVPSPGWIVNFNTGVVISTSSSYRTMVGSAASWAWRVPTSTENVPSGTPDSWTWRLWTPDSGRQVPTLQSTVTSWLWIGE